MAIGIVQEGGTTADAQAQVSRQYTSNVTAGSLLVIYCAKYSAVSGAFTAGNCTQTAGTATLGSITLDSSNSTNMSGNYQQSGLWSCLVTGSGSCTMQVGGGGAGDYWVFAEGEYSGNWDSTRVEGANNAGTATDGVSPAVTGTVASAGAALYAAMVAVDTASAITITPQAAFTGIFEEENGAAHAVGSAIRQNSGSGITDEGEWTLSTTGLLGWSCSLAVYKEFSTVVVDQDGFAFGDDNGSESAHTLDAEDTNYVGRVGTKTLRFQLDSTGDPATAAYTLRYRKNGAGEYVALTTSSSNEIYISASANVAASGEATTARLTAPGGKTTADFDTGRRWDDENGTDSIDITTDNYTEVEWVITTQSPVYVSDYFEFRVYAGSAVLSGEYTLTPKWTIGYTGTRFILGTH